MTTRWFLYRLIPKIAVVAVVIGLGLLLYSEAGLLWLWGVVVQPRLPAGIEVASVSGRLLDKVVVKGVRVDTPGLTLSVDTAWVDWRPSALLGFTVQIDEIVALGIDGESRAVEPDTEPEPPGARPERLPRLPTVIVDKVRIGNLIWREAGGAPVVKLRRATAGARVGPDAVQASISELDIVDYGNFSLALQGRIAPKSIRIDSLALGGPRQLAVTLAGECDWPSLNCRADLQHRNVGWPLDTPQWQSPEGELELSGSPAGYRARAQVALIGPELPPQALTLELSGDTGALEHFELVAHSLAGELDAAGSASWRDGIDVDLDLGLIQYDLATWLPDWSSRLNGGGSIQLRYRESLQVDAPGLRIVGTLRGEPFALDASVATRDRVVDVSSLSLNWADAQARGAVRIGETLDGKLELAAADLARLDPRARGRLSTRLSVAGRPATPHVRGKLSASQLGFDAFGVDQLGATFDLQWQREGRSELDLNAAGIDAGGEPIDSARLRVSGTLDEFGLEWEIGAAAARSSGTLSGRFDPVGQRAAVTLTALEIGEETLGDWALVEPARIVHDERRTRLDELCLAGNGAQLCALAEVDDGILQGRLRLTPLDLARFSMFWPPSTQVTGSVAAEVDITPSPTANPRADLRVTLSPITVSRVDRRDTIALLELESGGIEGRLRDGRVSGALNLPVRDGGSLVGEFEIAQQQVDARVDVDIRDLEVLTIFNPEIVEIDGALTGSVRVRGALARPEVGGQMRLTARSLVLDTPNIELTDVAVGIRGEGRSALTLDGRAQSGGGALKLAGGVDWSGNRPAVDARLRGEDFLASNSEFARVRVSPDLALALRDRELNVSGSLHVPMAHINVSDVESNGRLSPSSDEFVVGEDDREPTIRVSTDIRLSLGDDVRFSGFGLKTRIAGKLRTQSTSGSVATAAGELQLLEGRYKAYGQDLVIERGRLLFTGGAISEPGLDFRAYRQARVDVRAGVQVRGSLSEPRFRLYSDPAMRETDQLSYLVLGRAAEAQSESDQAALNNAALALGLQGGDFLAQKVKGRIGVDEVKIGAQPGENADQAALILGKYLTPDLYVSYGIGLFEPTYEFRMRYRLAERWLLQTESGVESGGDIFYTIER